MAWFRRRTQPAAVQTADDVPPRTPADAVSERRATQRAEAAYRRGREEGRRRRRGSPILSFLGLVVVAAAALLIFLAVRTGSFSAGGAQVDNQVASASQQIQAPIKGAENSAGAALENAGRDLKRDSGAPPAS